MAKVDFGFIQIFQTTGISSRILTTQTRQNDVTFKNEYQKFMLRNNRMKRTIADDNLVEFDYWIHYYLLHSVDLSM